MKKAEFIAFLEGYAAAKRDQEYPDPEMFEIIIEKAKTLEESEPTWIPYYPEPWKPYITWTTYTITKAVKDTTDLIYKNLPGPNDWSVDYADDGTWSIKKSK